MVRALRGAITVEKNEKEEIFSAVKEMMSEIMAQNSVEQDDMVSVIFTVTPDITAAFPAAGVRKMGITNVPLLDMAAPDIDGGLKMCIRVMVYINSDVRNDELKHIYLRGAQALRPDICIAKGEKL